jgi:hypothetical protein
VLQLCSSWCSAAGAVQLVQQLLFVLSEGMNMKRKASEEKPLKGCIWKSIGQETSEEMHLKECIGVNSI